jgi:hypothetical protein
MLKSLLSALLLPLCFTASAQTIYYVDASRPDNSGAGTSWASAKRDLQVAINAAASNDQVWVKAGTYLPTHDPFGSTTPANNRDKTFSLKNGVKVYGGFAGTETQLSQRNWQANNTVLSGDLGTANVLTDNAYHVVISVNLNVATMLDGVTITKGYATAPSTSSVTVNSRVINRYKGGGVYNAFSATTFTNCIIKANNADCTNTDDDAWGAGIVNEICTSSFTNCTFDGNSFISGGGSFGVFGAGMIILGGACTLNKCVFVNNAGGSGFFDGSRGGAIDISGGSSTITNCLFYNNSAMNGGALSMGGVGSPATQITNCTFANNSSFYAGTAYSGFSNAVFRNCIFWNNVPTVTQVAGRNEIYSQETVVANQPTFNNCIIRDAAGSPASVTNTIMSGCLNGNPLFVNLADGDGADNLFMTADDGLRLQCASPAIGSGTGTTPATDILNLPRTGTPDIGAYEGGHSSVALNTLPSANALVQLSQNASGVTHYSDCNNKLLEIQSGGSYNLGGTVTAKVWIETNQPSAFVKRHYEITPQTNASTATGRVTLYFKQQEFDDFNAVNTVKLPTSPSDVAGLANLKVEKKSGSSSDGTGLPDSYSGTSQTLSGLPVAVVWNSTATRWEISFDVTGFSGFFLKTQSAVLPLHLISFSGKEEGSCNALRWQTANEINTKAFEIQRSRDGIAYNTIALTPSAGSGNNFYQYADCDPLPGRSCYRLKMIDNDGAFTYSKVAVIERRQTLSANVFPNPAHDFLTITSDDRSLLHTQFTIADRNGKTVTQAKPDRLPYKLDISRLAAGLYYLRFSDGKTYSFIKQ